MYAIIRAGGKQAKVQSGDVIEIERVKGDADEMSFSPLLIVDDKGNAVSDRDLLSKASVTAKVLGESQGPKIDIFKYKNKTGYRRRQGHRQKYTQIEITEITLPGAKAKSSQAKPAAKSGPAKASEAKPATAKAPAAKKAAAKTATTKAGAAKTSKQAKTDSSEEE
ncbi:MAG: ribosomal protein [Acidimicrobiia bacterium]|jgi:large subunit ribosomal protein L21|nr:ribosomal protein [Acidimicrobiia bacterium]